MRRRNERADCELMSDTVLQSGNHRVESRFSGAAGVHEESPQDIFVAIERGRRGGVIGNLGRIGVRRASSWS
jgi:hypothetical protein